MAPPAPAAAAAATIPRCNSMKEGERTMAEVLDGFKKTLKPTKKMTKKDVDSWLDLFVHSFACEWMCGDCEYREEPESPARAYALSHGASQIAGEIHEFCSYFLIRKCVTSSAENREVTALMRKLTDFLHSKGVVDEEEMTSVNGGLQQCDAVDETKIVDELALLKSRGYWKSLPTAADRVTNTTGELYRSEYVKTHFDEMGLRVNKVTEEGWLFDEILLRLPPHVAKLGVEGMTIRCVELGLRTNGHWEPYNDMDMGELYGTIYPP